MNLVYLMRHLHKSGIVVILLIVSAIRLWSQDVPKPGPEVKPVRIVLVGDSTVATGGGWGPGFCKFVVATVDCVDLAANGRSTRSYLQEGLWTKALEARGKFYFIQFGHNDQKVKPELHTDPDTTFSQNLRRYIQDVQAQGATAILVTSLSRRNYKDGKLIVDPLYDYAAATRKVAAEEDVPLVDLYQLSTELLQGMTQQQADEFDAARHPDAKSEGADKSTPDRTHLNDHGKNVFGDMVARAAYEVVPALRPYLNLPTGQAGAQVKSSTALKSQP